MRRFSRYEWALVILVSLVFLFHLLIISTPFNAYVFDESHYVPAAKCLLNNTVCNVEHPPLGKAAIAGGITLFGDNGVGWRLPSVIAGTLSLLFLFLIVRKLTGDEKISFLSALLLGLENLWFTHSSIAMLDIIAIFFVLFSTYLLVCKRIFWSGIVLGVALLAKETMILILPVFLVYEAYQQPKFFSSETLTTVLKLLAIIALPALLIFSIGLGVYDAKYDAFPSPAHHIARMVIHNRAIDAPEFGDVIYPIQWFSGYEPSPYFVTSVKVKNDVRRVLVQYQSQPNLAILLLIWLSVPSAWVAFRAKRLLELLSMTWLGILFLIFIILAFLRITYPFYMLLLIPSVCILNACFLSKLPRSVLLTYLFGVFVWFIFWFPINIFTIGG